MTARNSQGVEVLLYCLKDHKIPRCPHGPTLLFERYGISGKNGEQFYACSACRDRKECNFFQLADASVSKATMLAREEEIKMSQPKYTHKQFYQRLLRLRKSDDKDRKFCHTCHWLLTPEEWNEHKTHLIREKLSDENLLQPVKLLSPLESNKSHAQYLFSDETNNYLVSCIKKLGFTRALCIGAPRLHEAVAMHNKEVDDRHQLRSLLLDIDHRLMQFLGTDEFCYYNMFNHYFFDNKESQKVFESFLRDGGKTVIVMDPPFGGLVEVLAHTLKTISKVQAGTWEEKTDGYIMPTLFFFPYYLEPRILQYLPTFRMSDYRVNYLNHDSYQVGPKGRKHGSPVRIFTNINLNDIQIPEELGYRWCGVCEMSVHATNKHCDKCNSCTSKDGSEYVHCDKCMRCVKPSRFHCDVCNMCVLKHHKCGEISQTGCHICGEQGHKRRECPKRHEIWSREKAAKRRRQTENEVSKQKLRKVLKKRKRKEKKK